MTLTEFLRLAGGAPLIASAQASPGSPLADPKALAKLAGASLAEGVRILRVEGVEAIREMHSQYDAPLIGLIKRPFAGSDVYITATLAEVRALLAEKCSVIALDGTSRPRPGGEAFADLIAAIHSGGALAMADCDSLESARFAVAAGADVVGTTLAGYTAAASSPGPDIELVRLLAAQVNVPVVAEGRYVERWQVEAALRAGAVAVVIGGALNDPVKQTRALRPRFRTAGRDPVGAVDIGGTWLRYALFSGDWQLQEHDKTPNPHDKVATISWLKAAVKASGVGRVGVSTAGIVDPTTGEVWRAKEYLMPNYVGIVFDEASLGVPTVAWGDGHATNWAHACLPQFAGRRVATLALGTGVGCGFVSQGQIWCGPRGEYPRINDLTYATGETFEDVLGGLHLTKNPTQEQEEIAFVALQGAVKALTGVYFPDDVIVGGGVGTSTWMAPHVAACGAVPSPLGPDAGLYGAAALALFM
ncbi:MAG: putative N-acetylmannosamine-6-phosphate 2-epimerase [Fimbriimonadaceae bacterium]